jgi:hypothetical protein
MTLANWVWVTHGGDLFGIALEDFRAAGIKNPDRRTPRLNYALLGDFIEQFMADEAELNR